MGGAGGEQKCGLTNGGSEYWAHASGCRWRARRITNGEGDNTSAKTNRPAHCRHCCCAIPMPHWGKQGALPTPPVAGMLNYQWRGRHTGRNNYPASPPAPLLLRHPVAAVRQSGRFTAVICDLRGELPLARATSRAQEQAGQAGGAIVVARLRRHSTRTRAELVRCALAVRH